MHYWLPKRINAVAEFTEAQRQVDAARIVDEVDENNAATVSVERKGANLIERLFQHVESHFAEEFLRLGVTLDHSVKNVSRWTRMPGTPNNKGVEDIDAGFRVHRVAGTMRLEVQPEVTRQQIEAVVGKQEKLSKFTVGSDPEGPSVQRLFRTFPQHFVNLQDAGECEAAAIPERNLPACAGHKWTFKCPWYAPHKAYDHDSAFIIERQDGHNVAGCSGAHCQAGAKLQTPDGKEYALASNRDLYTLLSLCNSGWKKVAWMYQLRYPLPRLGVTVDTIVPEMIEWFWRAQGMAYGTIAGLGADPSTGKTVLTMLLAKHVTRGLPWPDGSPCEPGNVIVIGGEDDLKWTIAPRLIAVGADTKRVIHEDGFFADPETGEHRHLSFPDDLPILDDMIRRHKARLVIIDPLAAYLSCRFDSHKNNEARVILDQLNAVVRARRCFLVAIEHLTKSSGKDGVKALYRTQGSIAFLAMYRASFVLGKDKFDPDLIVMGCNKPPNNARRPRAVGFHIRTAAVEVLNTKTGKMEFDNYARAEWASNVEDISADDLLNGTKAETLTKAAEASLLVSEMLADGALVPRGQIYAAGAERGIAEDTLRKAMNGMGVISQRRPGADGKVHRDTPYSCWLPPPDFQGTEQEARTDGRDGTWTKLPDEALN